MSVSIADGQIVKAAWPGFMIKVGECGQLSERDGVIVFLQDSLFFEAPLILFTFTCFMGSPFFFMTQHSPSPHLPSLSTSPTTY